MSILKDILRSLIEQDSDYWTIYNLSPELWLEVKRNENSMQWTDLMDYALCKLQDNGVAINDIAQNLKTIPFSQEMRNVLMDLKSKEIPVILLSDANTFYIETILTAYDVRDCVTQVITNPAYIDEKGRLRVQRYILASDPQHNCTNPCSVNICKGKELDMLLKKYGPLEKVAYIGDGKNDFCPATRLRYTDMLFMRQEKGLERFFNDEPEEKKRIKSSFVYWINPETVWKAMPNYFSLQL
ncbi:hypothetical protein G6F46_000709 [Rhizopus delemar]|uniref:2,3-diketo-5-methylthio-1-phosphopentane phosphatase n=3 Tax=Rhizopus TaxID=4842 RepID=I1C369_RHIO9|nr:hypothetical protein RO3G_07604 [Rhizopus delemar RA 99-880]KAG1051124.1 hypothetical protein G6F43_006654 [Rhizopus delemar]KAG1552934.1 hypothetical protein G6F51_000910 [Rhizopus arrhizus]KAG1466261.1 hypothetical protein G6F55_000602 [Rhizopus delemar]KAG1497472.1 hypothetical protein G6F54_005740 [Rhizopus delemar]|eukprot:EIE82899.1 hypothetical protein RO3G_07604 [Rhizopus delemar RA 99-880]